MRKKQTGPVPPDRRDSESVPLTRIVPWLAFFILLGVGVFVYFRYASRVTPLLG